MLKACSRCGKIHDFAYTCNVGRNRLFNDRQDKEAARLRSKRSWQLKRDDIKTRAFNLCEVCKDHGIYNYDALSVHHITKLSQNPSGLLDDDNLICLCKLHHEQADKGLLTVEYLKTLVGKRDSVI